MGSVQRETLECLVLNGLSSSNPSPHGSTKTASCRHNSTDILWTHRDCDSTLRPAQFKPEIPALRRGRGHKDEPLTKKLVQRMPAGKGKICVFQWVVAGCISHTPRQALCSWVVDQHKEILCLLFLFGFSIGFLCVCVCFVGFFNLFSFHLVCFDFHLVCWGFWEGERIWR